MKKNILILLAILAFTTSCNDWLDVRGENIQKEKDQFESYKGFRDALTGCYMSLASTSAYGQSLTMTDIEDLADLWYCTSSESTQPIRYNLQHHNYTNDNVVSTIKSMYGSLYNVAVQANVLLKNIDENGSNITDAQKRSVIQGEAYAIRAYCHFDVLRLFGQLPQNATKTVSLPYSYTTSINEVPSYYDFSTYVANLKADIEKAESLLKDNDPIFKSTFTQQNNPASADDDYMCYRQSRLNYWAVRALHARMALYLGETQTAHDIALEIINAKDADGNAVIKLSGISDLSNKYLALPSECLFYLSKYDVNTVANKLLIGGLGSQATTSHYYLSSDMLTDLYVSVPGCTASHNRYLSLWNRTTKNASGNVCPALKKYWYDESSAASGDLATKYQIIPMLRLSEMYLIAIETSQDLAEIYQLYDAYMSECQYTLYTPFATVDEAHKEMVNEYRREFFGEGQMFYVYKRMASNKMMWNSDEITEDAYILPLPSTETLNQ